VKSELPADLEVAESATATTGPGLDLEVLAPTTYSQKLASEREHLDWQSGDGFGRGRHVMRITQNLLM
jgi:hypothetical protein